MDRIGLNMSVVGAPPEKLWQLFSASQRPGNGPSRRRFLQGLSAATALLLFGNAKGLHAFGVKASGAAATLTVDGASIWSLDASWLAGLPRIEATRRRETIELVLSGARYPGTALPADFRATLFGGLHSPVLRMEHSLSRTPVEIALTDWLNGDLVLDFQGADASLTLAVGEFLHVRQTRPVRLALLPNLSIDASSHDGWAIGGSEFSGTANRLTLARPGDETLIDSRDGLLRSNLMLVASDAGINLAPVFPELSANVSKSRVSSLILEAAEDSKGTRHFAFLSQGTGVSTVSGLASESGQSHPGKVLVRDPQYARVVVAAGQSQNLLIGGQGQGMVGFGPHVLVTGPSAADGRLKIEGANGSCNIDCDSAPKTLALAGDDDISITLKFPATVPEPANAKDGVLTICPFTFRHKELNLDDAEITFKRPANALLLRFRFHGFKLVRTWRGLKLVVTDKEKCRLHLRVGAQAVVEQAFFEPPDFPPLTQAQINDRLMRYRTWLETQYAAGNAPADKRDQFIKAALARYELELRDAAVPEWNAGLFPSKARISRESQLVYRLSAKVAPSDLEHLALDLKSLMDENIWKLVVVSDAASSEAVHDSSVREKWPAQADKGISPKDATVLEIPSSLYISPNEKARFKPVGLGKPSPSGFNDIFRIAGVAAGDLGMPLRAIGAREFTEGKPPLHFNPGNPTEPDRIGFRTPIDMRDRAEFVWLSSQWNRAALMGTKDVRERNKGDLPGFGGIYVPQPLFATKLLLSSMGGSMASVAHWDPPALSEFALSVERWEHGSSFAKSDWDVVVYKGFLLPLGIRCSLVKVTRRQERWLVEMGVVSPPIQKLFIELSSPRIEYTGALAPFGGRTWPFRSLELLLRGRQQIDDPTKSDFCDLGQLAFKVCVGRVGFDFGFEIDGDSKRRGVANMAFVDNAIVHDPADMQRVTAAFNESSPNAWHLKSACTAAAPVDKPSIYFMNIRDSKVQYAPSKKADDTTYVTGRMMVRLTLNRDLVNSAIIEAAGKPPTFPEMDSARIVIPALNRITGRDDRTATGVFFSPLYVAVGFGNDVNATNESEVFLDLETPVTASFSGKGDRSGAVGSPNMDAYSLCRPLGIMGKTAQPLTLSSAHARVAARAGSSNSRVSFSGADLFKKDAMILGVLSMSELFEAMNLKEVPQFIESARHKIDDATGELNAKICEFAKDGVQAVADLMPGLDQETSYTPLAVLKGHLTEVKQALSAINSSGCTLEAAEQIGVAGQALDNARRCVEDMRQNPAMLLPAQLGDLVAEWSQLIVEINNQYLSIKAQIDGVKNSLVVQVGLLQDKVTTEANALIARELNIAYSCFAHVIENIATATVSADRLIQQVLAVYSSYEAIYRGVAGWYREIAAHPDDYRKLLAQMADGAILEVTKTAGNYVTTLIASIEAPIIKVENGLRAWPEAAHEQGRAFFRRYEPSVTQLTTAVLNLRSRVEKFRYELPQIVNTISGALDDLQLALEQDLLIEAAGTSFARYLADNIGLIEKARIALANAAMELPALKDATGKTVKDALVEVQQKLGVNAAVVLPAVISQAQSAWQTGVSTRKQIDEVIKTTNAIVQLCVVAGSGLDAAKTSVDKVDQLISLLLREIHKALTALVRAIAPDTEPQWVKLCKHYHYLLAPEFVGALGTLFSVLQQAGRQLAQASIDDPLASKFQDTLQEIRRADASWSKLALQLQALGQAPDKELIELAKRRIADLLARLVPAEVRLDFNLDSEVRKPIGNIFKPGLVNGEAASIKLKSQIAQNLITGESSATFEGEFSKFRLIVENFLEIHFDEIKFKALAGSSPKLYPPSIKDIKFTGCLAFVDGLRDFFKGKSGPYVKLLPSGAKAGYALNPGVIALPPMIVQNLVLDGGIEIPFDNRAAVTSFLVSTRQDPALLFIAPYGGAMFFGLQMAGDRLVGIEASFEAGLVSAFNLGAVEGTGRVTIGFYYRQVGSEILLDGFFFAGGQGTVLGLVSITVSLRIGVSYQGSGVKGHGEFSVAMGCSPFTWTLNYSVERNISMGVAMPAAAAYPVSNLETQTASQLFLNESAWREFSSQFAKI
ncbi:MAG: hypothetical protein HZB40_07225 [Rhodocyclales bacterium]|nr:hypothetical protein [Rhodocyclales bacterium]